MLNFGLKVKLLRKLLDRLYCIHPDLGDIGKRLFLTSDKVIDKFIQEEIVHCKKCHHEWYRCSGLICEWCGGEGEELK